MGGYIGEKCLEIEMHIGRVCDKEIITKQELSQECAGISKAVDAIKNRAGVLAEKSKALSQIETEMVKGGEPAFVVKRVKKIIEEANRKFRLPGLRINP